MMEPDRELDKSVVATAPQDNDDSSKGDGEARITETTPPVPNKRQSLSDIFTIVSLPYVVAILCAMLMS